MLKLPSQSDFLEEPANDNSVQGPLQINSPKTVERLVRENERLVHWTINRYFRLFHFLKEDLVQEGMIGLMESARRFDETRGVPFVSYARTYVIWRIISYVQDNKDIVRLSGDMPGLVAKFFRESTEFEKRNGRGLEVDELADLLGVTEDKAEQVIANKRQKIIYLDAPLYAEDKGGTTRHDTIEDHTFRPDINEGQMDVVRIIAECRRLIFYTSTAERDWHIFINRVGVTEQGEDKEPASLEGLSCRHGVTKQRIQQIETSIYRKIRSRLQTYLYKMRGTKGARG